MNVNNMNVDKMKVNKIEINKMKVNYIEVNNMEIKKWKEDIIFAFNRPEVFNNVVQFRKNGVLHNVEFPALIEYYSSYYEGTKKVRIGTIKYYDNGTLHRPTQGEGGPAILEYYYDGQLHYEHYFIKGKQHMACDKPATISYHHNGKLEYVIYYANNVRHRHEKRGPAYLHYHGNGVLRCEEYYYKGKQHRIGGPSNTLYYTTGKIRYQHYYINGKAHRPAQEGPAHIRYYPDSHLSYEEYSINGKKHRPLPHPLGKEEECGGPAVIRYILQDSNKYTRVEEYWVNGEQIN